MANNTKWLQRVVFKLNEVHLNGFDFSDVYRWVFDWDDKLSSKENLNNCSDEDRALTTLKQAGVINGISKDNFYREQQEWSLAEKGWGMWGDWDTTDPAHREYDYMWFIDGFDYDRFLQFCTNNDLSLNDNRAVEAMDISKQRVDQENSGQVAKLSLVQKNLKLNLNGITFTLKRFASTKNFNYKLMKFLLDRPDEWVSRNDLMHFKMISKAKDWPKLMGFTGELKDIFTNVDTKEQKIMLNPKKSLTPDEAEILKSIVNTLQTK
jgi:hypothetical protein